MKRHPIRVIEISIHRSKKNKRLGHAVALLFPCNHHRYLGLTLYKDSDENKNTYRAQSCRIIQFEDWDVMDKSQCKLCPHDEFWIDDLKGDSSLDSFVDVLEVIEDY